MIPIIRKLILFGILIGMACAVTSMFVGLLIYFITLSVYSPLALTILKYTTYISFASGLVGMVIVYLYVGYLVYTFIKNGIKL